MFESLIDMFPGIQQCVNADLTVMNNCTKDGFLAQAGAQGVTICVRLCLPFFPFGIMTCCLIEHSILNISLSTPLL